MTDSMKIRRLLKLLRALPVASFIKCFVNLLLDFQIPRHTEHRMIHRALEFHHYF